MGCGVNKASFNGEKETTLLLQQPAVHMQSEIIEREKKTAAKSRGGLQSLSVNAEARVGFHIAFPTPRRDAVGPAHPVQGLRLASMPSGLRKKPLSGFVLRTLLPKLPAPPHLFFLYIYKNIRATDKN